MNTLLFVVLSVLCAQTIAVSQSNPIVFDTPAYYPGAPFTIPNASTRVNNCTVPNPSNGEVDTSADIAKAFRDCGKNGRIIFTNSTYNVSRVLNTTGLSNVEIDIQGTLQWSKDTKYWVNNSLPVGYQNQSSAWIFGGDQVWVHGNGYGTLNGNGDVWYNLALLCNNYPGRPHAITFSGLTRSVVEGMRFIQPQMWVMAVIHSENVLLQDIFVNATKHGKYETDFNTDGADTIYANNISFRRWTIKNGDDSISCKANSTNILVDNSTFIDGEGFALGSIGQDDGAFETIENVTAQNIIVKGSAHAAYVKTWTGMKVGIPPNGGGGGLGFLRNVTVKNFTVSDLGANTFSISQCYTMIGNKGNCDSSKFQISDFYMVDVTGTQQSKDVVDLQCSGAAPCTGISLSNVHVNASGYLCSNVENPTGFECTGTAKKKRQGTPTLEVAPAASSSNCPRGPDCPCTKGTGD